MRWRTWEWGGGEGLDGVHDVIELIEVDSRVTEAGQFVQSEDEEGQSVGASEEEVCR